MCVPSFLRFWAYLGPQKQLPLSSRNMQIIPLAMPMAFHENSKASQFSIVKVLRFCFVVEVDLVNLVGGVWKSRRMIILVASMWRYD